MPRQTSSTHCLFLRIIATVGQSSKPTTVADIATALDAPADVIAHCIALHEYLERRRAAELPIPPPVDHLAPRATDVITPNMLRPKQIGSMQVFDSALNAVLVSKSAH
jgi:hypothetical protein